MDILQEKNFLDERRKLLRQRAGLTDKDKRKAIFSTGGWVEVAESKFWQGFFEIQVIT